MRRQQVSTGTCRGIGASGLTVPVEEKDLVIIGGGVAGYVAAIKAGQEGMKVSRSQAVQPLAMEY